MHDPPALQRVPVKVYRTDDRLTVAAPMPGLMPEDIRVEVTADNHLVLHGDLRGLLKGDKEVLLDEWDVGSYHRDLPLPNAVDGELATVTYGNGVLVVALPLADRIRPAQLTVEAAGPGHAERVGSAGHPVEPLTTEAHRAAKQEVEAEHGGSTGPFAG